MSIVYFQKHSFECHSNLELYKRKKKQTSCKKVAYSSDLQEFRRRALMLSSNAFSVWENLR